MPILETPSPNAPLGQGDLLKGVNLHATTVDGEADVEPDQMALVLSRECVIENREAILVAHVTSDQGPFQTAMATFEDALNFFKAIRDGDQATDTFYLSEL